MQTAFYIVICFASIVLMFYILVMIYFISGILTSKKLVHTHENLQTKISVIIPVRNEAQNINACLNSVSIQTYPEKLFEVIIIDDSSDDETQSIVRDFCKKNSNFSAIALKDFPGNITGKKNAIQAGIKNAKGSLIVTTDGDCTVHHEWLKTIASFYETEKPKMILGPVAFHTGKNLFQKIQSLEFLGLIGITEASANLKNPIMCNGANLAYEKSVFEKVEGFSGNAEISSGDDVILMHKLKKEFPDSVRFLYSVQTIVQTHSKQNFSEFFDQRIRWASKAKHYSDKFSHTVSLLVFLINFLVAFVIIFALETLSLRNIYLALILLCFKCLIDFFFLFLAARKWHKTSLMKFFLPAEFFVIIYTSFVGLASNKKYRWKGRVVK